MKQVHAKIVEPWQKRRLEMSTMLRNMKENIKDVLGLILNLFLVQVPYESEKN